MNTVEELNRLCENGNMSRFVSPDHKERIMRIEELVKVSEDYDFKEEFRRSFELLKHAFLLLHARTHEWTDEYTDRLMRIADYCEIAIDRFPFIIEFDDVFEILDKMTSKVQSIYIMNAYNSICMDLIFKFIHFVVQVAKSPDEMVSFKQVAHRLVHSQMKFENGGTLLHHAINLLQISRYSQRHRYLDVIEVLLECGANVSAVDRENNTALHLCTTPFKKHVVRNTRLHLFVQNERDKVIKLLLRYSPHIDIVNDSGNIAAEGLQLKILDHVNLQCLAASVIRDRRIPYVGNISAHLGLFVQMHGRCPIKTL